MDSGWRIEVGKSGNGFRIQYSGGRMENSGMKFEDLQAWQKARELTNQVYSLCRQKPLSLDYGLRDQIQRASVSCMNNIAEGFERQGKQEKWHFYNIAKGSSGEVRSLSYVLMDNNLAGSDAIHRLQQLASETGALIHGLMRSTKPPLS